MGDVVELDPERAKVQARYDELKAQKPNPKDPAQKEAWKELMRLGRELKGDQGGRHNKGAGRGKPTKAEAREHALRELYPKALAVLADQIDAYLEEDGEGRKKRADPMTAQKAAFRIVDQVEGKAAQTIKNENVDVKEIRYVTAARSSDAAGEDAG